MNRKTRSDKGKKRGKYNVGAKTSVKDKMKDLKRKRFNEVKGRK